MGALGRLFAGKNSTVRVVAQFGEDVLTGKKPAPAAEKTKGTLEAGKLADMAVLPEDLLAVSPEKLLTMKVDMTIIGGKILHERNA